MTTDPEEFSQEIHHASPERPVDVIYDAVFRFELETGQITEWNAGAEELYGWRRQDALGRQPHELLKTMHDRPRDDIVAEVIERGRWSGTLVQTTRSGDRLIVDARWALTRDADGSPTGVLEVNRDQTRLRAALADLEFANQVMSQLNSSLEPAEVLDRLLTIVVAASQATHATAARVEGEDAIVEASFDVDGEKLPTGMRWRLSLPDVLRAVRSPRTVASGRIDPRRLADGTEERIPDLGYRLTVPLVMGERVIGLLSVGRSSLPFTPEQQKAVERIAASAAMALHNAWLYRESVEQREAARRNQERLGLAIQVAGDLATEPDLEHLTKKLLDRAIDLTGADRGSISRIQAGEIVVEHCIDRLGDWIPAPGDRFPMFRAAQDAIRGRRPVESDAEPTWSFARPGPLTEGATRLRHLLAVPLVVTDEVVGLLNVVKRRDERFTQEQVDSLQQVAAVAALLLRSARLLDDARRAEAAKSEFINLAGHELRTPLTVLKGYMSMLVEGGLGSPPETWQEPLAILGRKLGDLDRLIESVIAAARADSLQLLPSKLELDLNAQAGAAAERARARAKIDGAIVVFQPANSPVLALADPEHLARILDTLINNSLDYSQPPASVTVEVHAGSQPAILVRDRGVGIPEAAREAVFERFVRLMPEAFPAKTGTGLGLYLSRRLARSMGGDVEIQESEVGKGTVMRVRLSPPEAAGEPADAG